VQVLRGQDQALERLSAQCHRGEGMIDPKTKRITVPVTKDIDLIRERIKRDTGIDMTYVQIFNFLIHFYVERANEPKSKWKALS
jgi:hypothetical protein